MKGASSSGKIDKYLSLNLKILSIIGLRINVKNPAFAEKLQFIDKIPVLLTNLLGISVGIGQVFLIVDSMKRKKTYLAAQISGHVFSNVLCISKGYRLATRVSDLQNLLQRMSRVWNKYLPIDENREKILKTADNTLLFCKLFVTVTFSAVVSFGLPPIQNIFFQYMHREVRNYTYDYSQRVFIVMYPFKINDIWTYFSVLFEEEYLLLASALYWICCDTLFATLTSLISLMLQVLKYDIEKLINNESDDDKLKENLVACVNRHRELLSEVEYIYSPVILSTVLLSAINICFNVFEMSETISQGNYSDAAVHVFLFMNTFLQIVFFCTFAETLTEQSRTIGDTVYNCKWTEKNHKFGIYLQMFIMKSQNPFYCTAYGFFPIGHRRLTMVLNTSFSYYMMLQATT